MATKNGKDMDTHLKDTGNNKNMYYSMVTMGRNQRNTKKGKFSCHKNASGAKHGNLFLSLPLPLFSLPSQQIPWLHFQCPLAKKKLHSSIQHTTAFCRRKNAVESKMLFSGQAFIFGQQRAKKMHKAFAKESRKPKTENIFTRHFLETSSSSSFSTRYSLLRQIRTIPTLLLLVVVVPYGSKNNKKSLQNFFKVQLRNSPSQNYVPKLGGETVRETSF